MAEMVQQFVGESAGYATRESAAVALAWEINKLTEAGYEVDAEKSEVKEVPEGSGVFKPWVAYWRPTEAEITAAAATAAMAAQRKKWWVYVLGGLPLIGAAGLLGYVVVKKQKGSSYYPTY